MKKTMTIVFLLVVAVAVLFSTTVNAATTNDVLSYLKQSFTVGGETVKIPQSEIVKVERYLKDYPITNEEADSLLSIFKQAEQVLKNEGTTDINKLSSSAKDKIIALANQAADIVDVKLVINSDTKTVQIVKDGKVLDVVKVSNGKLVYTGTNINALVCGCVVLVCAGILLLTKKGLVKNAK